MTERPSSEVEPVVAERSFVLWEVYSPSRDGIAFTSESRDDAERAMRRVFLADSDYVLRSVPVRSRSETWWGEPTVVPWTTPCSWEGAVGDSDENLRCSRHGWHRQSEPVPAEFWRPASAANDPPRPSAQVWDCFCKVVLGHFYPCGTHEDAGYEGIDCDCDRCVQMDGNDPNERAFVLAAENGYTRAEWDDPENANMRADYLDAAQNDHSLPRGQA